MTPAEAAFLERTSKVRPGAPLVLVVEDTADQRDLFVEELEAAGFAVLQAADGETAIDAALQSSPEAMVLDLMIPKISGFSVARVLRSNDRTRHTTILAVTALASDTFRVQALDAGCDMVLRKPIIGARVVAEVVRLLAKRRNPRDSTPAPPEL